MKILCTGANGFLGSHIIKGLLSHEHEIYAISLNSYRLTDIMDKIHFSTCPMNSITSLESRIRELSPDLVIHCAWDGGSRYADIQLPSQFYKNLPGLADLMGIIKKNNIPHFIGIGSGAEYGNCPTIITEENREVPTSLYGTCKLMAKLYTESFCNLNKIKWTWIRPFFTYGPNDVESRMIPTLIKHCINKDKWYLDECKSIVDYLYIDDFVDALRIISSFQIEGLYNVCSSNAYQVQNIVNKIGKITDNEKNINFGQYTGRIGYPTNILGSGKKIEHITGWTPKINIDEGLLKTIEWYKRIYEQ